MLEINLCIRVLSDRQTTMSVARSNEEADRLAMSTIVLADIGCNSAAKSAKLVCTKVRGR